MTALAPLPHARRWLVGAALLAGVAVAIGLSYGACSQDDAFISFRYAQNLVDGHGLVFNPGERVEGYTNLSWTLMMAGVLALGIDPVAGSAALGLVCLAGGVLATAALARRLGPTGPVAALAAAALVALDPWTALEAVEGLETALYLLLLTLAAERALAEADRGAWPVASSALLALAVLTRPEAPLVAALLHLGLLVGASDRPAQLRRALAAGVAVAVTLGLLTAWRLAYYGEPLPNTFYAKTGGLAVGRGLTYWAAHARDHPALWGLLLLRPVLRPFDRRDLALLLPAAGILAYVVVVGGDFKPTGRFILPLQGMLAALAGRGLASPGRRARGVGALAGVTLLVGAVRAQSGARAWADVRHGNLEARRTVGLFLAENLPPDTLLAIHSAGAVPYYARLPTIDMWGLADHHIARTEARAFGAGLAGHEKADPAYVFGRDPALYLPEDRMFAREPVQQPVEPGFPADFADRYNPVSVPIAGRYLNLWARKGFLAEARGGPP